MTQLLGLFPKKIESFYEPFVGGGSVFLNIPAEKYYLNDIDGEIINIHKFLLKSSAQPEAFFQRVEKIIYKYELSRSYKEDVIPNSLKRRWRKTYFAKFNRDGYQALRQHLNENSRDPLTLYVLLIYGFNRMLRFNSKGEFNLPVGNVDFNKNVVSALSRYFDFVSGRKITLSSKDFREFILEQKYAPNDFVYFDPPYLISASEYNKLWHPEAEAALLSLIDTLSQRGTRFALSNVVYYNGRKNNLLCKWMNKYEVHKIDSNYINYHNNKQKQIEEVLVTNY